MSDIVLTVQEEPDITLEYVEAAIKPETVGHVTPKRQAQTVYPASGTVFGSVEVEPSPDPILQNTSITPTKQKQTATADSGFDGLGTVEVEPIPPEYIIPQGKTKITQNVTGFDVSQYAEVDVDVSDKPDIGVWYSDYDEDGYPHSYTAKGLQNNSFRQLFRSSAYFNIHSRIENVNLINCKNSVPNMTQNNLTQRLYIQSDTSYEIGVNQVSANNALKYVIFNCNISRINADAFNSDTSVELYDFSKNTIVPSLASTRSVTHAEGCVIRVPQSLLAEWQAAPNWSALTDVIWEGV